MCAEVILLPLLARGCLVILSTREALVAAPWVVTTPSGVAFHAETLLHRPPKRNLGLGLSANPRVRVAVESGLESTNRFDLRGYSLVAEKPALLRERNPELPCCSELHDVLDRP